ncbi:MAG: DUF393 domain-containing protein [Deferribacteres bacterium]|nr:DUF393 domain-containing protein [candidate division KSB1 bacterium]MCB9500477.1 DUF393 domain-containing protein [Deferribacteres bacterium]
MKQKPVILFDGVCNLCSGTVSLIQKLDRNKVFEFLPLQYISGKEKQRYGLVDFVIDFDTVVLVKDEQAFIKSEAILEIASELGGMWKLFIVLRLLPKSFRDSVYDVVAKYRYRVFGKKASCEWK